MSRFYADVAQRATHRCEYGQAPEAIFNMPFDVEHIVPTSRGGPDQISNLALACRSCNVFKSDQQVFIDEVANEEARLFDPRQNRWDEHFRLESGEGIIVGITSIGRVTIACLRINDDIQLAARKAWIRLGLYP
jgi:hypothetical protein